MVFTEMVVVAVMPIEESMKESKITTLSIMFEQLIGMRRAKE